MNANPNDLSRKEFYVDPDPGKAESLPYRAFTDPQFLDLELDTIFRKNWVLLPSRSSDEMTPVTKLANKQGLRIPISLLGKPLFVQISGGHEIRCFANVCTHAWYPLVESATVGGSIVCPQHGRKFDNSGKFMSHMGFERLENFPRESDNLKEFRAETWGPLLFTCLGAPLAGLTSIVSNMSESVSGIDLESVQYRQVENEIREVDGNWKQHCWNYMDNYHIRFVHKGPGGLADAIDLNSYSTELHNYSSLQWAYARHPKDGFAPEQIATRFRDPNHPERRVFALWWFIFPNLALNFYPWGLSINQYMPVPGKPQKTEFHWYNYSFDDTKFEQRNETWLNDQVDAEDIEAISLVSRGASSGLAPRGRFAPREEQGPHWFHRLVYTGVFGPS